MKRRSTPSVSREVCGQVSLRMWANQKLTHHWRDHQTERPLWTTVRQFLQHWTQPPRDAAVLFRGMQPREITADVHTISRTGLLTAAWFVTAKKADTTQMSMNPRKGKQMWWADTTGDNNQPCTGVKSWARLLCGWALTTSEVKAAKPKWQHT